MKERKKHSGEQVKSEGNVERVVCILSLKSVYELVCVYGSLCVRVRVRVRVCVCVWLCVSCDLCHLHQLGFGLVPEKCVFVCMCMCTLVCLCVCLCVCVCICVCA